MPEIILTGDGSHTLFVPELNEHYHSIHGAIQESEFIFINCGYDFCKADPVRIFEAGFGTGLNALLTYVKNSAENKEVFYTALEKYPLPGEITKELNYKDFVNIDHRPIFKYIHSCKWEVPVKIGNNFILHKIKCDLTTYELKGEYDLIYFDAFGPGKQPEMWTNEIFRRISEATASNGIFVTYSAKGEVRRSLQKYGFEVNMLPGPPGKRQIIRAVKI